MNHQIVVTGGTGYIGAWVVKYLLEKGYRVRLTMRDKDKLENYSKALGVSASQLENLEAWQADLLQPHSFDQVMEGATAVLHMASPFRMSVKDPRADLLRPAVDGTTAVLNAATKAGSVKKIVLTSSVAAVFGDTIDMTQRKLSTYTEGYWNETSSLEHQPYSYSKTMAEKKAWELAAEQHQWQLVVLNPGFVMGPSLTADSQSESIQFMKNLIGGKFRTGVPDLRFGLVDVRDVALAHIAALENAEAEGRHLIVARTVGMPEMVQQLKDQFPGQLKLPLMQTPKWLAALVGRLVGISPDYVRKNVGHEIRFDNRKSREQLGLHYRPVEETLYEMANQLKCKI